jgi:hypothetical protein
MVILVSWHGLYHIDLKRVIRLVGSPVCRKMYRVLDLIISSPSFRNSARDSNDMLSSTIRALALLSIAVNLSDAHPIGEPETEHRVLIPRDPLDRRATQHDYAAEVVAAANQMQTSWYNSATGLWDGAWWNSANVVTTLADFAQHFPGDIDNVTDKVFPITLAKAPKAAGSAGFINGYYDDELWWTLAWIQVYDVTGNKTYLDTAATIFENSKISFGSSNCGALW